MTENISSKVTFLFWKWVNSSHPTEENINWIMDKTTTIEWLMIERSWFFQESTPICTCAENQRRRQMRSNTYLYSIWYRVIENATFDIPYLCCKKGRKKKRKKTEMFDKLVSRQKQNRDGGGRCWWQVYYATEATGEANNWEMELSQHFAKCATPKGVTLSLVKTRWNNSLRRLASVTQDMPVLSMWHTI